MSRRAMRTTEHESTIPCPLCRHPLSASSNMTGEAEAEQGAITICLYCRGVLVLENKRPMMVRPAEPAEYADQADRIAAVQEIVEAFMRSEGRL